MQSNSVPVALEVYSFKFRAFCIIASTFNCCRLALEVYTRLSPGVKRAHLVDARLDGGLILELYSRDGVGIMISGDFYEGASCVRS
jgi:hypothetical protein